jgi:hypothetical protein
MALEVIQEITNVHEDSVCCIAYNRAKRAVYTVAEGDKAIKVSVDRMKTLSSYVSLGAAS